jgi:tripartite-type tricarboxylate transporter receptor subunit TctC
MKLDRVRRLLLAAALPSLGTPPVLAQPWPSKPVRMIVPTAADSAPDVIARLVAERLSALWGQAVIVENKHGAGGIHGMSTLAHSPNDGYTIGFVPAAMATITPLVYKNPLFNPDTQLQPVATVGLVPLVLVTQGGNGIQSLADLARRTKLRRGMFNLAAPQMNSLPHLAAEMVARAGDMGLYTVPYPSSPAAMTAVIAGDAVLTGDGLAGLQRHIKAGRLRALAVTSAKRMPGFDDVPAVAETYPGFEVIGWFQIFVPTGTPAAVTERVNADVNRVTQGADIVARFAELGVYPRQDSLSGAREFFAAQQRAMKKLVNGLGVTAQ